VKDRGRKEPNPDQNYWRQVGPDPSIRITVFFENAPGVTPLIDVNGVLTAINGPYRDVPEPPTVKVGGYFYCASGMLDTPGKSIPLREWILEVNNKAYAGEIHSDTHTDAMQINNVPHVHAQDKVGITWPASPELPPG